MASIQAIFSIGSTTGILSVAKAALDYENTTSYFIVVKVDDGSPQTGQGVVTVIVMDVNEAPTAVAAVFMTIAENSVFGTQVRTTVLCWPQCTCQQEMLVNL
jgi:hypothetical protein